MVDDRSSTVSLPEVPLLGVLPGTGGLTRADRQAQGAPRPRRRLLHDRAKACAPTARKDWKLVDRHRASRSSSRERCRNAPTALAAQSMRPGERPRASSLHAAAARRSTTRAITTSTSTSPSIARAHGDAHRVRARTAPQPDRPRRDPRRRRAAGGRSRWRASSTTRSCMLRTNELEIGTWILKTRGELDAVLAVDARCEAHATHWFVRETHRLAAPHARAPRRLVAHAVRAGRRRARASPARSLELALAADRTYMLRAAGRRARRAARSRCRR